MTSDISLPLKIEPGPEGWFSWGTSERNLLRITLGGLIVVPSCAYCHGWLRTYDAAHSKVRKESHPERA
jgi:hypothetical protein